MKNVSEQRLADQVRQIKVKNWLETLEQDEIIARVKGEQLDAENDANQQHQVELCGNVSEEEGNENVMDGLSVDRQGEEERVEVGEHVEASEEVRALRNRLLEVMEQHAREMLPSLKSCDKKILKPQVDNINEAVSLIPTTNAIETYDLLYAAAYVTTDMLGKMPKKKAGRKKKEPFWKRRIKNSIAVWRRDLRKIEEIRRGKMKLGERNQRRMDQKYKRGETGALYVSDMLKQKITAGGIKIKR